jgi:SAM-dependent methyltransferase
MYVPIWYANVTMNFAHNRLCAGTGWARFVDGTLLPWGLEDVELGDRVLEIGPGFGATTRRLIARTSSLSVLELDRRYCRKLSAEFGDRVEVTQGDATQMPFPDERFSAVLCFTMLHHIDSPPLQDRLLAEAARVLRPGGTFAGTDSIGGSLKFKLLHVGDTLTLITPSGFPERLTHAGLTEPVVEVKGGRMRFRAQRPR